MIALGVGVQFRLAWSKGGRVPHCRWGRLFERKVRYWESLAELSLEAHGATVLMNGTDGYLDAAILDPQNKVNQSVIFRAREPTAMISDPRKAVNRPEIGALFRLEARSIQYHST